MRDYDQPSAAPAGAGGRVAEWQSVLCGLGHDATDTTWFEMLISINMKYEIQFDELFTSMCVVVLWVRAYMTARPQSKAGNVIVIYEGKCCNQYIISAVP